MGPATIFVDFDGTVTESDVHDRIAQIFGDPGVYAAVDKALDDDRMTLHEVLRREFEPVRASLDEVVAWVLEHASIRPGFAELIQLADERGWRVIVLSSGFRELIAPVLEREGLSGIELVSNHVEPDPAGWRVGFRDDDPCDVCGEPCKRAAVLELASSGRRIYVGDGLSDRCGARASDVVFARRGLAAFLTAEGAAFEEFEDFFDVAVGIERSVAVLETRS